MDPIINFLESGLNGAMKRQGAIADNIANVNTPGYKRKDVDFISTLKRQVNKGEKENSLVLKTTDNSHINGRTSSDGSTYFKRVALEETAFRNDRNSVDIDVEMAELTKNNLYYDTLAQRVTDRFKQLKNVIDKGGR